MIITNVKNIWSSSTSDGIPALMPQRTDLWQFNLEPIMRVLRTLQLDFGPPGASLPPENTSVYYAKAVIFPEQAITQDPVRRGTIPYLMPSWDQPCQPARVTFYNESSDRGSRIYRALLAWLQLARQGRFNVSNVDLYADMSADASLRSIGAYRKDIQLSMMSGTGNADDSMVHDTWIMHQAWCSKVQPLELSQDNGTVHTIDAEITCAWISPIAVNENKPVSAGGPSAFGSNLLKF